MSPALASAEGREPEAVACNLDPGNTNEGVRLPDLLQATLTAFEQRGQALRLRLDAGYGHYATLDALKESEVGFALKWKDNRTPRNSPANWLWTGNSTPPRCGSLKVRSLTASAAWSARSPASSPLLITNLDLPPRALFDYYNQRQTIEAFFRADKHVFCMANLRSRRLLGIAAFLWFVMITHNLLVWTKALFAGTRLATARTRELVEKVASIPALIAYQGADLRLWRSPSDWPQLPSYPSGVRPTGFDFSEPMLEAARRRLHELGGEADLRLGDGPAPRFGSGRARPAQAPLRAGAGVAQLSWRWRAARSRRGAGSDRAGFDHSKAVGKLPALTQRGLTLGRARRGPESAPSTAGMNDEGGSCSLSRSRPTLPSAGPALHLGHAGVPNH